MEWFVANLGTIVISIVFLVAVFFALRKVIGDVKANRCSGCDSSCCGDASCSCHSMSHEHKH